MANHKDFEKTMEVLTIATLDLKILKRTSLSNKYFSLSNNQKHQSIINIIFFNQNLNEIKIGDNYKYSVSEFYPINLRPFGRYWLPTPNNVQKMINIPVEENEKINTKISSFYPYINRICHNENVCTEELKIENFILFR